ncbi:MAG: glycosyltransferase family 1 protein [Phycisphaerales bacterium]|nr:MAG: glycosyltransferase family 1 protein [Phycisphaerales bacterium]
MRIGLIAGTLWEAACRSCGIDPIELESPFTTQTPYDADLAARVETGRRILEAIKPDPPDVLLDNGAAGLTFIEGPGGMSDLKLTHEYAGVPLVSHFTDPVTVVLRRLNWSIALQVLQSKRWTKAIIDPDHAEELRRFGIPNVIHLPAGAPEFDYETDGLTEGDTSVPVSFVGDAAPSAAAYGVSASPRDGWIGPVAATVRAANPRTTFFDIYHKTYECGELPADSDSLEDLAKKAANYFAAKHLFIAQLALHQRDRFIIYLKRTLGDRFHLAGRGWQETYGLQADKMPVDEAARIGRFRSSAINIALIDEHSESAVSRQHFEIAASGGFLLCYDHRGLSDYFEIGKECDTFTDEQSLREKILFYQANPAKRREIARAGQERALRDHLAGSRLKAVLQMAEIRGADKIESCGDPDTERNAESSGKCATTETTSAAEHSEAQTAQVVELAGKLLILLNPGNMSRHWMLDIAEASMGLGIETLTVELGAVWQAKHEGKKINEQEFADTLRGNNVRAVLSYTMNGLADWSFTSGPADRPVPFFERLGIPHIMWWSDQPQWANEKEALRPNLQEALKSPNHHHFVKSDLAALELEEILGWPNCHGMPLAEGAGDATIIDDVEPEFDVVAVAGSPPNLTPEMEVFLDHDDPDVNAITGIIAKDVAEELSQIWQRAPSDLRSSLQSFGQQWLDAKCTNPLTGLYRLFKKLEPDFPDPCAWLRGNYAAYFEALEQLWRLRNWMRTFTLRYLAKYFSVGVFGKHWGGTSAPGGAWVEYHDQVRAYARGKIAINVLQGNDEEGVSHKPFQIAAAGVPMLHNDARGLPDYFTPDKEVALFRTPREARDQVAALLANESRRQDMGRAVRDRLFRDHTWRQRLPQILSAAGVSFPGVTLAIASAPRDKLESSGPAPASQQLPQPAST